MKIDDNQFNIIKEDILSLYNFIYVKVFDEDYFNDLETDELALEVTLDDYGNISEEYVMNHDHDEDDYLDEADEDENEEEDYIDGRTFDETIHKETIIILSYYLYKDINTDCYKKLRITYMLLYILEIAKENNKEESVKLIKTILETNNYELINDDLKINLFNLFYVSIKEDKEYDINYEFSTLNNNEIKTVADKFHNLFSDIIYLSEETNVSNDEILSNITDFMYYEHMDLPIYNNDFKNKNNFNKDLPLIKCYLFSVSYIYYYKKSLTLGLTPDETKLLSHITSAIHQNRLKGKIPLRKNMIKGLLVPYLAMMYDNDLFYENLNELPKENYMLIRKHLPLYIQNNYKKNN